jgi:hypothetical protein
LEGRQDYYKTHYRTLFERWVDNALNVTHDVI